MTNYAKNFNPNQTPQTEQARADQVENNAGGYVFALDKWARLDRFLILGSDSNTYYQTAQGLTRENGKVVMECWSEDAQRTVNRIVEISLSGRAPKNDPAIFALALGAVHDNVQVRQKAYEGVTPVCRTATHLFTWKQMLDQLGKGRGGSRAVKRTIARWYAMKNTDSLAYQMIKYRQRNGYTHKRMLEIAGQGAGEDAARKALYLWARGKERDFTALPALVRAHEAASMPDHSIPELITQHKLPWEAIPTEALREQTTWEALTPHLGLTALIRNLGRMTNIEFLKQGTEAEIVARIQDEAALKKARVHPFSILLALATYRQGRGDKGSLTWNPVPKVLSALNQAFRLAFANAPVTGKRIMIGLDVSGSMGSAMMGSSLTVREAAAAMSLVTLATETSTSIFGFTAKTGRSLRGGTAITPLPISADQRLDDVVKTITGLPFGATDCALPMLYAIEQNMQVDAFIVYTDNETWHGDVHPFEALKRYRRHSGIHDAKLIVVGMTSTGFSIADPNDPGMLDIVGFDASAPALIADFIGGPETISRASISVAADAELEA